MSLKDGFRFALATKLLMQDGSTYVYQKNRIELIGSIVLKPLNGLIDLVSRQIRKRHMIALVTLFAGVVALVVFYNIPAIKLLGILFNPQKIRFLLFCFIELNIFAAGCNAFGRFGNRDLIEAWQSGKLIAIYPGDKRTF
jgi:hypothetical protein